MSCTVVAEGDTSSLPSPGSSPGDEPHLRWQCNESGRVLAAFHSDLRLWVDLSRRSPQSMLLLGSSWLVGSLDLTAATRRRLGIGSKDDDDGDDESASRGLNYVTAGALIARRSKNGGGWGLTVTGAQSVRAGLKGDGVCTVQAGGASVAKWLSGMDHFEGDLGVHGEVGGETGRFVVEVVRDGRPQACFPAKRTGGGMARACLTHGDAALLRASLLGPENE